MSGNLVQLFKYKNLNIIYIYIHINMICDGSESKRGIFDLVGKIICIGDLHGDIVKLLCILLHANLIKKKKK